MPLSSSDLVFYASQNMPTDDISLTGGDIDTSLRVIFTDISVSSTVVTLQSDNASDTQSVNIIGRLVTGVIITETVTLAGTTPVSTVNSYSTLYLVQLASNAVGNIAVTGATTLFIIPPGEQGIRKVFYDVTAPSGGGAPVTRYEKIFLRNNNTIFALLNGSISEIATGVYGKVDFAIENNFADTQSVANRLTSPTNISTFGSGPISLPGNLTPSQYIGIWLRLLLNPGDLAVKSFYRLEVNGDSTS